MSHNGSALRSVVGYIDFVGNHRMHMWIEGPSMARLSLDVLILDGDLLCTVDCEQRQLLIRSNATYTSGTLLVALSGVVRVLLLLFTTEFFSGKLF